MNKIIILTGTSRGLGAALAEQVVRAPTAARDLATTHIVTLARKHSEALERLAQAHDTKLTQIVADLNDATAIVEAGKQLHALTTGVQCVRMIHNAGVVTPIAQSRDLTDLLAINRAFQVNITAPIYLTAQVLSASAQTSDRRIMLISSGAGRSPSSGWGVYCATKAAMDRYAECAQLDEGAHARIVSMAPGVIDTAMQETIRATPKSALPSLERFVEFQQNKQLASPEDVARRLLLALESDDFGKITIDDIRQHTLTS